MKKWQSLVLALVLILPSLGHLIKFGGLAAAFFYIGIVFFLVRVFLPRFRFWLESKFTAKGARNLALVFLLLLTVAFFFIYPMVNYQSGKVGSDRDDDADMVSKALLSGQYPYYQTTYLGNPSSHFPGGLFFSLPFVALTGKSAWQNIFWLFILLLLLKRYFKDWPTASALFISVLCFSPIIWYEIFTGGDLVANSIYIFALFYLFSESLLGLESAFGMRLLWGFLLGVSLSSRLYFLYLLPPFFFFCLYKAGWRKALGYWLWVLSAFLAVTLPFYLFDPQHFMPLQSQWLKVESLVVAGIPFRSIYMGALFLVSLWLPWRAKKDSWAQLFMRCVVILALVIVGYVFFIFFHHNSRWQALLNLPYGFGFTVFALFALGREVVSGGKD